MVGTLKSCVAMNMIKVIQNYFSMRAFEAIESTTNDDRNNNNGQWSMKKKSFMPTRTRHLHTRKQWPYANKATLKR